VRFMTTVVGEGVGRGRFHDQIDARYIQ
jgi:hypothetical protein